MTVDPPLDPFEEAVEPDRLRSFIAELEADGFTRVAPTAWEGPTRQSLIEGGHTSSTQMTIVIRPSWPYLPPLLHVPGIHAWHADQELLCIWQSEDNSQRWVTLQGLNERIDEWAAHAKEGFALVENARNPEIYWQEDVPRVVGLVDLDELRVAGTDGQQGEFHFTDAVSANGRPSPGVYDLRPGGFTAMTDLPGGIPRQLPDGRSGRRVVRGRWFYRSSVPHPPRNLDEFRTFLTDNQRLRLDKDLRDRPLLMFGLFWGNRAGLVGSVLLASPTEDGGRTYGLVVLRPKGRDALLLRAGPDAQILQEKTVAVLGVGAIGSHAAQQLARAGIARLRLVDHDLIWPVNLIRHAAPPGTPPGIPKTTAVREDLELYPWVDIEEPDPSSSGIVWTLDSIEKVLESVDLTIDATGHGGLAELIGRVAHSMGRPYISVALLQGGRVARVRRQAHPDDVPLLRRPHLDRYPEIPPLPEEVEYVGTEVGCLARVHNAPPVSVIHAAALAVEVAIDHLTGRTQQPDEIIEVIRPGEAPFDRMGRLRREDLPYTVDMSETAQRAIRDAAQQALPNETGGVLLGCVIDERPVIAEVIEIKDPDATARDYMIPEGRVNDAVSEAHARDPRLGYLGEWHSHSSEAGPSPLDLATMLGVAENSGATEPILVLVHPQTSDSQKVIAHVTTRAGLRPAEICITGDLPDTGWADAS